MSTKAQEFVRKFKIEFLLVSYLTLGTLLVHVWLLNSGATRHMTGAREQFNSLTQWDSVHFEFAIDTKYAVKGVGIVIFQLELRGKIKVKDILWVPKLSWNILSVTMMEKGFFVAFQDGKVLIKIRGCSYDEGYVIGVREQPV